MSSLTHKYNTRLTSGAIKRGKYIYHDSSFEDDEDISSDDDSASISSSNSSITNKKSKVNKLD